MCMVLKEEESNITEIIIWLFLYLNVFVTVLLVQSIHLRRWINFKCDALATKSSSPVGTEIKWFASSASAGKCHLC